PAGRSPSNLSKIVNAQNHSDPAPFYWSGFLAGEPVVGRGRRFHATFGGRCVDHMPTCDDSQ
ncbi:unnamed protein product, partial [Soboliphyme baturini]|uniref:COesterase domain-containing protein n=1 Tax=Soboliphyme baturini TaxID=241478 RepID=A0A183IEI8_9BILA